MAMISEEILRSYLNMTLLISLRGYSVLLQIRYLNLQSDIKSPCPAVQSLMSGHEWTASLRLSSVLTAFPAVAQSHRCGEPNDCRRTGRSDPPPLPREQRWFNWLRLTPTLCLDFGGFHTIVRDEPLSDGLGTWRWPIILRGS